MDVIVQSVTRTRDGKCGLALSQSKNWPTINGGPTKQARIKQSMAKLILLMTMMMRVVWVREVMTVVKGRMNSRWLMAGTSRGNLCDI